MKRGRQRAFPHVVGSYPSHVMIPIPEALLKQDDFNTACTDAKRFIEAHVQQKQPALAETSESVQQGRAESLELENMHISLSKVFTLRNVEKQPFVQDLSIKVGEFESFMVSLTRDVETSSGSKTKAATANTEFCFFSNESQTTGFAGLSVVLGGDEVRNLIRLVDDIVLSYQKEPFYKPAKPHLSLAWMNLSSFTLMEEVGNKQSNPPTAIALVDYESESEEDSVAEQASSDLVNTTGTATTSCDPAEVPQRSYHFTFWVTYIVVKICNQSYRIDLRQ